MSTNNITGSSYSSSLTFRRAESGSGLAPKVDKVVSRTRFFDFLEGVYDSRIIRATVVTALVAAIAAGILFLVVSSPPLWMIGAVSAGGVALGILLGVGIQLPFKGKQKIEFEFSTLGRLLKRKNYDLIGELPTPTNEKIFLGALPNRLRSEGERLVNKEDVGAVLSINEPWERGPLGLSLPYQDDDWGELGVTYKKMNVLDHTLLDDDFLNESAAFIHDQLTFGKNVYVHCRAGAGRSAMAIAAYLIKYRGFTVSEACKLIKTQRPLSTIYHKAERLLDYQATLDLSSTQRHESQKYQSDKGSYLKALKKAKRE